jgi:dCMP deaminase
MKQKFIDAYMDVAQRFAQLSTARRLKVGAIIVKDHRIISIGYNGTPPGWDNNCEQEVETRSSYVLDPGGIEYPMVSTELVTRPEVIHAERNAIDKLARDGQSGLRSTLFVTHGPCLECSKSIFTSGISCVFYGDNYRDHAGLDFLARCGVEVQQVTKKMYL